MTVKINVYGQPTTCMPCKILEGIVKTFEQENKFNATYEYIDNQDVIIEQGFRSIPILSVVSEGQTVIQHDKNILTNEDNLLLWLSDNIK